MKKFEIVTSISYPKKGAMGKTGSWRVFKPVLDTEKCVNCLLCWVFCPESCIEQIEEGGISIDYEYCKGCGVCATECKVKAITMKREQGEE